MHLKSALLAASLALIFASCAGNARDKDGYPLSPNPVLKLATFAVGPATVTAELAATAAEREKGLMFRSTLAEGRGMLFIFPADQRLTFWMKNTSLPLSIAWIGADGRIKGLADMEPFSLAPVDSEFSVRYALEVPRGWFGRAGVGVGDLVALPPATGSE